MKTKTSKSININLVAKAKRIFFAKLFSTMICLGIMIVNLYPVMIEAAGNASACLQLSDDMFIDETVTILSKTISLPKGGKVFLQSDGRLYPNVNPCAQMRIYVDGNAVGNASVIDWQNASFAVQHSFNCIAELTLSAGTHIFSLLAIPVAGSFTVGEGSNLSIMTNITVGLQSASLENDTDTLGFTTYGISSPIPVPHSPLIRCQVNNPFGIIIALASGRGYYTESGGDMMLGIFKDGKSLPNYQGMWTVNDSFSGCERQAPMYTHVYMKATGSYDISLDASEIPWPSRLGENPARYKIGSNTSLIVLNGLMKVSGCSPRSLMSNECGDWYNIGNGDGTPVVIASASVDIPDGHDGVVMFEAKTRFQGDRADKGGNCFLWITIDGVTVGSTGIQQLADGGAESQRTACASYLAAGAKALPTGTHEVIVYAKAVGSFLHLCTSKDVPLIWFDAQAEDYPYVTSSPDSLSDTGSSMKSSSLQQSVISATASEGDSKTDIQSATELSSAYSASEEFVSSNHSSGISLADVVSPGESNNATVSPLVWLITTVTIIVLASAGIVLFAKYSKKKAD